MVRVVNYLGPKSVVSYLPTNLSSAKNLVSKAFEGKSFLSERKTKQGDKNATTAKFCMFFLKNLSTGEVYPQPIKLTVKSTISKESVELAFKGITLDGVKFDELNWKAYDSIDLA